MQTLLATLRLVDLTMAATDPLFKNHVVTLSKDGVDGAPTETTDESVEFDDLDTGKYKVSAFSQDINGKALTSVFTSEEIDVPDDGTKITVSVVGGVSLVVSPPPVVTDPPVVDPTV